MKKRKTSIWFFVIGILAWLIHIGTFHNQLSVFAGGLFYTRVLPYLIYWAMGCGWIAMLDILGIYRPWRLKPTIRLCLAIFFAVCSIFFVFFVWILPFTKDYLDILITVYADRILKSFSAAAGVGLFITLTSQTKQE